MLSQTEQSSSSLRVAAIDTLKAWAIFIVVLSHNQVMEQGGVGNCIFFAVSGFMAAAPFSKNPFENRFTSVKSFFTYYAGKIVRIMPSFWIVLLCSYMIFPGGSARELFSAMLLKDVTGHIWFLQNTMLLYFLTPFLGAALHLLSIGHQKKTGKKSFGQLPLLLTGVGLLLIALLKKRLRFPTSLMTYNEGTALIYTGQYLIGMAFAFFWRALSKYEAVFQAKPLRTLLDVISFVLLLFPIYTCHTVLSLWSPQYAEYHIGWRRPLLCTIVFALLIVILLLNPNGLVTRLMSFGPFAVMGRVSFGIYLVHWYIIPLCATIANTYIRSFTVYALSLGIAIILYGVVEKPLGVLMKTKSWQKFFAVYTQMDASFKK
ncbi:MAG: acyltransferase [Eubacteriales bacterium]|nr:acyltransferase [Eubacteriales bacterium]